MADLLWQPSDQQISQANITRFIEEVNQAYNLHITNYEELHQWSIDHMEDFWRYFWKFSNVISKTKGDVFATSLHDFIVTDKLRSYTKPIRVMCKGTDHLRHKRLNNRV